MHTNRAVHAYAHRILCVTLVILLAVFSSTTTFAAGESQPESTTQVFTDPFDRYDGLSSSPAVIVDSDDSADDENNSSSQGDLEQALQTRDEIELNEFNNVFLDTVIYIIGGLAGMMMLLQITAFAVCKVYPSWNHLIEKLSFIGITGYEDGWILPSIKILLLGILSYFCISGVMKNIISYILGWFVNLVNFNQ